MENYRLENRIRSANRTIDSLRQQLFEQQNKHAADTEDLRVGYEQAKLQVTELKK